MTFGDELAQARGRRELTQTDLAGRAGTKQPNIAAIEAGKREPRLAILLSLARALDSEIVLKADGAVEIRLRER